MEALAWDKGRLIILDQTQLPASEVYLELTDYRQVVVAIQKLQVRGAPLIGIAGAYALALAARQTSAESLPTFRKTLQACAQKIAAARPTAVNLSWALQRLLAKAEACHSSPEVQERLLAEAKAIHDEDREGNQRLSSLGAALLPPGTSVLTHCNTGFLATGGYGTALGVIRAAWRQGRLDRIYAMETRPLLQGARLTAWELSRENIPVTLIVDSAAGQLLRRGQVSAVIVGADRISSEGDVANKIGTYPLAVLAQENNAPFYVAAPTSTIDLNISSGDEIRIEERNAAEVTIFAGSLIAAPGVQVENPAFDVTPARYITAIITENGVARPPYGRSLALLCRKEALTSG